MTRVLLMVSAVLALAGCDALMNGSADLSLGRSTGNPKDPWNNGEELRCEEPNPGPAPTRRLSHVEYRHALEDLFGNPALAAQAASTLTQDPVSLGFSNSATLLDVKPVLGQQYMEAAELVAEKVTENLGALLPCNPAGDELGCATEFITTFGRRAFRRDLTADEIEAYRSRYAQLRAAYDFRTGIEFVVSTMLQSPDFLYRPEFDDGYAPGSVRPVAPLELASRLSFLIWHSVPDETLLSAAEEGRLSTREDVEREVRRMLEDPRGARLVNFFEEWLDVNKLGEYPRNPSLYGELPDDLTRLFREETRTFVRKVVFEEGGDFGTLLTADYTYANDELAAHYGLPRPGTADFVKIALPAGRRGVWMQGGPLTSHDKTSRTSIVNRGVRVRTALLCQNIPAPPNDVNLELGPVDQNQTQADRLAEHRTNAACAGCHKLLDPVGQLFENVDPVGRLRGEDEAGNPVETAAEITSTKDLDGFVADGAEFLARAAQSEQVRHCFATQLFRYAHGREEQELDACSQKQAYERFAASGYDVKELIVGIALSDGFLYRRVQE